MSERSGWFPFDLENESNDVPHGSSPVGSGRSGRVVGVGAFCDFANGPPEQGATSLSFSVDEFVVMEDGQRVVVDHRGWTTSSVRALVEREDDRRAVVEHAADAGFGMTPESIRDEVLKTVLPDDDDEAIREPHPWADLAEFARMQGVQVTAEELKRLEYEVVLSDRLIQWLTGS